jgi:hypothetical protein
VQNLPFCLLLQGLGDLACVIQGLRSQHVSKLGLLKHCMQRVPSHLHQAEPCWEDLGCSSAHAAGRQWHCRVL